MMIASLMMYQRPQLVGAHNRYWALIRQNLRQAGIDSPEQLSQEAEEFFVWQHPELVLSQTCGMPYRTWLHDKVELVGTPDFGISDCPPGYYRSALVVRAQDSRQSAGDFRDAVFAYNQSFSQSGYAAPYWHLRPRGLWFENRLHTEQHLNSAMAVAGGRADIAALDAVTWRLMLEYEPFATSLRVLEWTAPTPGLPLITARGNDASAIFAAVKRAIAQLGEADRTALGLKGIVKIDAAEYLAVNNPDT
ncbi:phosphate/phosphite/phosphonate ABC transporter substrate-binding protein [Candidatus Halocynthiibacter alkanivorans]|uniref:phosphate/phosphite/phosphonate ABC transporter substrate-binding protein n=1 Tax=Candidatus Halocynthiibacter alkanivorans TaxID=2267619 RepID=UPI0030130F91